MGSGAWPGYHIMGDSALEPAWSEDSSPFYSIAWLVLPCGACCNLHGVSMRGLQCGNGVGGGWWSGGLTAGMSAVLLASRVRCMLDGVS